MCRVNKAVRAPTYPGTEPVDQYRVFQLIFSDIHGPLEQSREGYRYMVHFTCAASRYSKVYMMHTRDDVAACFANFLTWLASKGYKPEAIVLRTDNDNVYVGGDMVDICESHGILQQTTAPYRHTNATLAERLWRTLLQMVRTLMSTSKVPTELWPHAARHAAYLYNRRPHAWMEMLTPHEAAFHQKPCLAHLRVFGCPAYALMDEQRRESKLAARAQVGIYVRHEEDSQGALTLRPDFEVVRSGDVTFVEELDELGKLAMRPCTATAMDFQRAEELAAIPADFMDVTELTDGPVTVLEHQVLRLEGETFGLVRVTTPTTPGGGWLYASALLHENSHPTTLEAFKNYMQQAQRDSVRNEFYLVFEKVLVAEKRNKNIKQEAWIVSHDPKADRNMQYMVAYDEKPQHGKHRTQDVTAGRVTLAARVASISGGASGEKKKYIEPRSYKHALSYPDREEWIVATQKELQSFIDNGVLELCDEEDIPLGKNITSTKMVYKVKYTRSGAVERYKARPVCRGFTQVYGEDFDETFAPVSQLVTVKTIIALALQFGLKPMHVDVKTAFLNAKLEHEVYVELPPGVTINGKRCGKALKSIYGLRQAARDWHKLQEAFILGFDSRIRRSGVDPCLYYVVDGDFIAMIYTHVDDYIIATNDDNYYKKFMEEFGKKFTVTELGVLDHILQIGVQWSADRKKVELSQERHIRELAEAQGLHDCKPISTPMEKDLHLEPAKKCNAALPYRSIIGSLLWIARATRLDIMYAVIYLARFSSCYDNTHFVAAKRIMRYLMSTLST